MIRFLKKLGRQLPVLKDIHRYILALEAEREELRKSIATQRGDLAPGARDDEEALGSLLATRTPRSPTSTTCAGARASSWQAPEELQGIDTLVEEQLTIIREMKRWGARPSALPGGGEQPERTRRSGLRMGGPTSRSSTPSSGSSGRNASSARARVPVPALLDLNEWSWPDDLDHGRGSRRRAPAALS